MRGSIVVGAGIIAAFAAAAMAQDADTMLQFTRVDDGKPDTIATAEGRVPATRYTAETPAGRTSFTIENRTDGRAPVVVWESYAFLNNITCEHHRERARKLAELKGLRVASISMAVCGATGEPSTGRVEVKRAGLPSTSQAAPTCRSDAYLGAWQRKGEGKQKPNVQIVFETVRGASAPTGSTRGFRGAPFDDGTFIAARIRQVGTSCSFDAQCGTHLGSANPCKLEVDPKAGRLRVEGGSLIFVSDLDWTRTSPMAADATCRREDIEGNWRRSDGAIVPIVGVEQFKDGDGGVALLFNHPEGWWPKGQHKFTHIVRVGGRRSCRLLATCATYDRAANGGMQRRERTCGLTVDPVKRRLTESGSSLYYTREATN